MTAGKMRLGMSIRGYGYHPAAWRHPDVPADGTLHVEHYVRNTQVAESGKLDMIFFADGAGHSPGRQSSRRAVSHRFGIWSRWSR